MFTNSTLLRVSIPGDAARGHRGPQTRTPPHSPLSFRFPSLICVHDHKLLPRSRPPPPGTPASKQRATYARGKLERRGELRRRGREELRRREGNSNARKRRTKDARGELKREKRTRTRGRAAEARKKRATNARGKLERQEEEDQRRERKTRTRGRGGPKTAKPGGRRCFFSEPASQRSGSPRPASLRLCV